MFKISKLQLWNKNNIQEYKLNDITYVYGTNSVGKTLFAKCIDYVLGTTDQENELAEEDGMDHVTALGACVVNEKVQLWLKRDINSGFYYKYTETDAYNLVSRENYIEEISKVILPRIDDNKQLKVYQSVFEETPTFRAFTFLNFISESRQGDLKQIFTKGNEIKNQVRIKKIMTFFFNYKNVEAISEKEEQLNINQKEYNMLSKKQAEYQYLLSKIKIGFQNLGLKFTGKSDIDKKTLKDFKHDFNRKKPKNSGDLIYLSKASFSLAEEIKQYNFLSQQSKRAKNRKKNDEALLKLLEELMIDNSENSKYLKPLRTSINKIRNDKAILSLTNYDVAIQEIQKEKEKIDSQIAEIKSQASELDYDNAKQQVLILDQALSDFIDFTDSDRIMKLEEENKQIKREIRDLQEQFDDEAVKKFNHELLNMYFDEQVVKNIKYVADDKKSDGFSISFNPLRQKLSVKKYDNVDQDQNQKKVQISFIPGSLARRTHMQILVYLLMLKYVINEFPSMRVLPLLVIDSADQAFKKENFKFIYPEIVNCAEDIGIQLIFISKEKPENTNDYIDIGKGFNPFYK